MIYKQRERNDLQAGLQEIAKAVESGTRELANRLPERADGDVDKDLAPILLDYLVIRELLSRGDPKQPRTFQAQRTRGGFLTLPEFPDLPQAGTHVAVFTRPESPAEIVDLWSSRGSNVFRLQVVQDHEAIVRLELQRDGFPIALGPRLEPV